MSMPMYCDGIESIRVTAGMVRMELFAYAAETATTDKPADRRVVAQIVIPPQGFLQAFNGMQKLVAQLESQGLIQRNPKDGGPQADRKGART